ncbi:MAG TPA: rhodanese-like domain-containing protein [Gemmatimonadaceae bacterium]|nr:rhodanese-like domain-containing protein [Gemmatimonadaceae bacterium]
MRQMARVSAVAALVVLSTTATAQRDNRSRFLISPAALAQRMDDRNLVLLHFGERAQYDSAHIGGARFVSLQDISVSGAQSPDGLTLQLPAPEDLRTRLAALGVGDSSFVVVYFGKDWISPTTRMLFTLDYAGLGDRSAMLDGGMPAWLRDGRAVTTEVVTPRTATLSPLKTRPIVADAEWVNKHRAAPHVAVVDSRDTVFYKGTRAGGRPGAEQRAGHIAGAKSVFFATLYDSTGALLSSPELRSRFARAGVQPGDTVVTYCHIGQQASATLFAARVLGHPVLLYDGSFEDWSRRAELSVEKP